MLSALSIDDQTGAAVTLHETSARSVLSVDGLVGIAPVRRSVRQRPTGHGAIDESRYLDEALTEVVGDVYAATQELTYAELRTVLAPMLATLDGNAALLKWTEGATGLALQRLVKLASAVQPTLSEAAPLLRYQAVFAAQDPRAYSQTLTTATGAALSSAGGGDTFPDTFTATAGDTFDTSGGGTASFTNAGNRPTPPVLRIYGQVTNPQVVHPDGRRIALIGDVAASDYLEIDVQARTINLVQGAVTTSRLDLLDAAATRWFELAPGTTVLQLVGSPFSGTARLDVLGRSAYT